VEALLSRSLAYEHEGAVKFKMTREPITIPDLVVGDVTRELTDRERLDPDFVIVRSDGQPVFHLTNVVDDLEMAITHVIRGEDHLTNTAKHIALFRAFGVEPPQYAHIPLILNIDGSKMSKRDKGASLAAYIEDGYAPEAVVNYLCLLGWSPGNNREKVPLDELIELFDLPRVLRHNARFDIDKLHWLDGEYIREMGDDRFRELGIDALRRAGYPMDNYSPEYLKAALDTCKGKIKRFGELAAYAGFYFTEELNLDPAVVSKEFTPESLQRLAKLREAFAALDAWDATPLEATLKRVASELGIKPGMLVHPVRMGCTGSTAGPSLYHLLEVLGKPRVLQRLDKVLGVSEAR
jgi:glutamyl-tRNA synthetase